MQIICRRFGTAAEAVKACRLYSLEVGEATAMKSPDLSDPAVCPFTVERGDGGMLRNWETILCRYRAGKLVR